MNIQGVLVKSDFDDNSIYFYFYSGYVYEAYTDENDYCTTLKVNRTTYINNNIIPRLDGLNDIFPDVEITEDNILKIYNDWNGKEFQIPIEGKYFLLKENTGKIIEYKIKHILSDRSITKKLLDSQIDKISRIKILLEKEINNGNKKLDFYIKENNENKANEIRGILKISNEIISIIAES